MEFILLNTRPTKTLAIKKLTYCISLCLFILVGRTHAQPGFNLEIKGATTGAIRQDALGHFWVGLDGIAHHVSQYGELLGYLDSIPSNNWGFTKMQRVGTDVYCMTFYERRYINLYKIDYKGQFTWIINEFFTVEYSEKNPYYGQLGFYVDTQNQQIVLHGLYSPLGGVNPFNGKKKDCAWWKVIDFKGNTVYEDTYCTPEKNTFAHHVLPHPQTGGYVLFCDKGNDFQFNTSEKAFLIGLDSNGKRVKVNDNIDFYLSTYEMNGINNGCYFIYNNLPYLRKFISQGNESIVTFVPLDSNLELMENQAITIDSFYRANNIVETHSKNLLCYHFIDPTNFKIFDRNGKILKTFSLPVPENTIITDLGIANDGGIYGCGWSTDKTTPWYFTAHIFKLDSNGNLNVGAKNPEIDMGLMLQPNPAQNQVYLRIPYDIGMVEATFYDMHGKKVMQSNQMSDMPINIQHLQNGLYIIKAKSLVNGVERTFKMEKI